MRFLNNSARVLAKAASQHPLLGKVWKTDHQFEANFSYTSFSTKFLRKLQMTKQYFCLIFWTKKNKSYGRRLLTYITLDGLQKIFCSIDHCILVHKLASFNCAIDRKCACSLYFQGSFYLCIIEKLWISTFRLGKSAKGKLVNMLSC